MQVCKVYLLWSYLPRSISRLHSPSIKPLPVERLISLHFRVNSNRFSTNYLIQLSVTLIAQLTSICFCTEHLSVGYTWLLVTEYILHIGRHHNITQFQQGYNLINNIYLRYFILIIFRIFKSLHKSLLSHYCRNLMTCVWIDCT